MLTLPAPPRFRALLLDSNLLLILAVGRIDPQRLGRDSRLKAYTRADYEFLHSYAAVFPSRVTTPHILAEVSNHLDHIDRRLLAALSATLSEWNPLRESWTPASKLITQNEFASIGLTDAAVLQAARSQTIVLTADRELWMALAKKRRSALHYADVVSR